MIERLKQDGRQELFFRRRPLSKKEQFPAGPDAYVESKVVWVPSEQKIEIGVHTFDSNYWCDYLANTPATGDYFATFTRQGEEFVLEEYKELPYYNNVDYAASIWGNQAVRIVWPSKEALQIHFSNGSCDQFALEADPWVKVIFNLQESLISYSDYILKGDPKYPEFWQKEWAVGEYSSKLPGVVVKGSKRKTREVIRMEYPGFEGMANTLIIKTKPVLVGQEQGAEVVVSKQVLYGTHESDLFYSRAEIRDSGFFRLFEYDFLVPSHFPDNLRRLPVSIGFGNYSVSSIKAQEETITARVIDIRNYLRRLFSKRNLN